MRHIFNFKSCCFLVLYAYFSQVVAAPIYQPNGVNLTLGDVTHNHRAISANGNPAAAAMVIRHDREVNGDGKADTGISWGVAGGIEYGNIQEIFDTIDALSAKYSPSAPDDGVENPGQEPPNNIPPGWDLGEIIDIAFPNFRPALDAAKKEITTQLGILAVMKTEGYAKGFVSTDLTLLSARDMAGGNWTFGLALSGAVKSFGLVDEIEFDLESALEDLRNKFQDSGLLPGAVPLMFDVVGDVDFSLDPNTGKMGMLIKNDSSLLTKASKISEFSLGYSKKAFESEAGGRLFLGAEAKYYDLKLSRLNVRFGDITDSKELFEAIKELEYRKDNGFGVDLGALWFGNQYQIGATITNVNEPTFYYPKIDLERYSSASIINTLLKDEEYTMERQLKLESAFFSEGQRWIINFGIDANSVADPVGDEFQWATVSASYTSNTNWLKNVRVGYRQNLAGSEISYLSVGATAFKYFNFDLASSFDTVKFDGDELPRGLMLSVGFNLNF